MIKLKKAQEKDQNDPLASFKKEFHHAENEIYLDGNSLGKLPLKTKETMQTLIDHQWGNKLIRSWNEHWLDLPNRLANKLARLIGAKSNEVIIGESTSVNLYKLAHALMHTHLYPKQLLTDALNFPTDNYILEGLSENYNYPPTLCIRYPNDLRADLNEIKKVLKSNPGILCLSLVTYKSAYYYPMLEINQWAKEHQSVIIWDFSHAVGAVNIDVKKTQTLAAIGCTYKYLNGGPGSPAFLYLDNTLHDQIKSPIKGWFGHQKPFDFADTYHPAEGIQQFYAGTPAVLSLAALEVGLDITLSAGIKAIRKKNEALTQFLLQEVESELISLGYAIESPKAVSERGAHITLSHDESWRICQCLLNGKDDRPLIIPDFRPKNYIRLGIASLYIGFEDLLVTVHRLKEIIVHKEYLNYSQKKPRVT
jgi:kynureninase